MLPFVVDHRPNVEASLQIYRSSRALFKANNRGQRPRHTSADAPPPAYTPTAETMSTHTTSRKATSGSIATTSSNTSTGSTSSTRSRLARLNPFRRHRKASADSNASLSPTSSTPASSSSSTTSTTARTRRPSRTVRFADSYDSDASSVYSTDFSPSERAARRETSSFSKKRTNTHEPMPYPRSVDDNSTYPAFLFMF